MTRRARTGGTEFVCAILLAFALILTGATQGVASHKVRKGDTLWQIARKHHVSVSALARANGLTEKSTLSIGRGLAIPGEQARVKKARSVRVVRPCSAVAYTCADNVVLRSGPSTRHSKVAALRADISLKVIGTYGSWRKVEVAGGLRGFVYRPLLSTVPQSARSGSAAQQASGSPDNALIRTALACRGARYRRGGTSRGGFDCSGFTRYVFAKYGVGLPHSASAQARLGTAVAKNQLEAGDLVFFRTYRPGISHVGIYIGEGKFVHASTYRGGVRVDFLSHPYYTQRYRAARRVK